MPRKLALWFVLLIVGFLTGFILQHARLRQAQQELSDFAKDLGSCQSSEQLSQPRDTATMMYLETVQKNHGEGGVLEKVFRSGSKSCGQHGGFFSAQLTS